VDTLVVDKTGTLTQGRPTLAAVEAGEGADEAAVLGLAASLERGSEHPLAAAILEGANARGVPPRSVERFESVTGQGVKAQMEGRVVALGNQALMEALGVRLESWL